MCRFLFNIVFFGLLTAALAGDNSHTLYIQIIRGTSSDAVIPASYQTLGPKLDKRLTPVFRWKYYWEVSRQAITVNPGKPARVRLEENRAVEVQLLNATTTEIRLYRGGKLVRASKQSVEEKISLMGWDDQADNSWFVAVRREKPQ